MRRSDLSGQPELNRRLQWGAAFGAGLIPGLVLLLVPHANPWGGPTLFGPIIMGRTVPPAMGLSLPAAWAIHLAISVVYGLLISVVAARLRQERAIIAGGVVGLVLFGINWAVAAAVWPWWQSNLFGVFFTHLVFGLISGGTYRGLRRNQVPVESKPPPAGG